MTATLLAPQVLARELGIPAEEWDYLELRGDFPAERRPVHFHPVASMAFRSRQSSLRRVVDELDRILDTHPGRVLVHSQTFAIARDVVARSRYGAPLSCTRVGVPTVPPSATRPKTTTRC